jgi:hypothetical protein
MRAWKAVFAVAALFNLAVGLPLLIAPAAFYAALGQPPPPDILSSQTAGLLIAVFGVGYGLVARDPVANRGILWLGVIGKTPLPLIVWLNVQAGRAPMSGFVLALGDLVFAALFLTYLLRSRK